MFEIDKEAFGAFLADQRKAKGFTQKILAEKLFISDKAVSKWERGLSMPDISLLIPLADILEISVTELLEGRKLDHTSEMDTDQVEVLVKKALSLSEDNPEKDAKRLKEHAFVFSCCAVIVLLELALGIYVLSRIGIEHFASNLLILEAMSIGFGIYFWFFMKDRLPTYYDENKINFFSDGVFRMNVPGVHFNNSNWPYIVKALRAWAVITMIAVPLLCLLLSLLVSHFWWAFAVQNVVLILYLAGLFVPIYVVGKKYE